MARATDYSGQAAKAQVDTETDYPPNFVSQTKKSLGPDKALHLTAIPRRPSAAGELIAGQVLVLGMLGPYEGKRLLTMHRGLRQ